jgi:hypothetical protein
MQGDPPPGFDLSIDQARIHRLALIRGLIVCAVWLATLSLRHAGGEVRLGLNLLLAAGGWWAVLPGRREGGPVFGEHGHWTSLVLALPIGFGIAAAAELWHLVRGAGG